MSDNYLSIDEAISLNNAFPIFQNTQAGTKIKNALSLGIGFKDKQKYYVDSISGNDGNDGLSWDTAFKTIQYAVNKARYLEGTTIIDSSKNHDKYVFVAPGQYNEQVLFSGYGIHLIGLGDSGIGGGDYGVVINYDDAVASTGVLGCTGVNIEICNITINTTKNIPAIIIPSVSDGIHIHKCFFKGKDAKTTSAAIDAPSLKGCIIENNVIQGFATGIKLGYDAGQWFYLNAIQNNHIVNVTDGMTIANGAVGISLSRIQRNNIIASTGSITNAQASDIMIIENYVKPVVVNAGGGDGDNTTLA